MPASKRPLPYRPCAVCGALFSPPRRDGTICSPACRSERKRRLARERYDRDPEREKARVNAWRRR